MAQIQPEDLDKKQSHDKYIKSHYKSIVKIQPKNIDKKISCNKNLTTVFCSCPYVKKTYTNCCNGCEKPGLGAPDHNPDNVDCLHDCSIFCCPCALIMDIITYPYQVYTQLMKDN